MYGATCLGIDCDDAVSTVAMLVHLLDCGGNPHLGRLLADSAIRTDSMGLGEIVYWPHIDLPESFTEDDDTEDDE